VGACYGRGMTKDRTELARKLRTDPSEAERKIWQFLRGRQMAGVKFRRQHPIGRYFADFACPALKLVIEIDGHLHALQTERDGQRDSDMQALGWKVVRISAVDVVTEPDGVWDHIDRLLRSHTSPPA
jgi:very-short-patch-repair endonuclease